MCEKCSAVDKNMERRKESKIGAVDEKSKILDAYMEDLRKGIDGVIDGYESPRDFEPLDDDIFIVTWMKSGTTLMQNLYYQLMVEAGRVSSDPNGNNYRDISAVVPFIEMGLKCGVQFPVHPYEPIAWKSHSTGQDFSKASYRKCKFFYMVREGKTVARSFLDFTADWVVKRPCPEDLREAFYRRYFYEWFLNYRMSEDRCRWVKQKDSGIWFQHVRGWLDSENDNVVILPYEDIVKDLAGTVRMVGALANVEVTEEMVANVVEKCSRKVMANDTRFNDVMVSEFNGLDVSGGRRVRDESRKGFAQYTLPRDCIEEYDKMFAEVFSLANYEALVEHVRARNKKILERLIGNQLR